LPGKGLGLPIAPCEGRVSSAAYACALFRGREKIKESGAVIASDSEAIQTKPQRQTSSLDRFALLAMTDRAFIL